MTELALFACAFVAVFALGFQSLNVNGGHYFAAFVTSFAIGGGNLVLMRFIPGASLSEIAATLLGGPFGIVAAMWVHRRTIGRRAHRPHNSTQWIRGFEPHERYALEEERRLRRGAEQP